MFEMFDKGIGRKISAGVALLFALVLAYSLTKGGYTYLKDVALTKPLFIYTNPVWGLWLLLLLGMRQSVSIFVTVLILFSLPLFAATAFYLGYWPLSTYLIGGEVPSLGQLSDWFLTLAYGPYAAQFDYFAIANRLSNFPFYRESMLLVMCSMTLAMVALIPTAHTSLIEYLAARRDLDDEQLNVMRNVFSLLGQLVLIALFYNIVYPLFSFAGTLPMGLNYLAVWTLLLTPLFGLGVARFNRRLSGEQKLGVWLVRYFALALLAILVGYIWVNIDNLLAIFALIRQGESMQLLSLLFLLSPLFAFYMLTSIKKGKA
ncbi:hypothetical protein [Shewanella halotolerans]|uniref:hypothetical protein n=1 Tax=Shewanella halotolerans TaxID=2864204 RepID=UPI001C658AC2|nr:hypothetical protein [Shewanella halotolerans]QYJ88397.1 hypothetical protein K0H81_11260 [Shewanella halotolerans]